MIPPITATRRALKRCVTAALILVGTASCGSSPAATSAPSRVAQTPSPTAGPTATPSLADPCKLLTKQDAETIVGTPVLDPEEGNPANPSCTYNVPVTGPVGQISIYEGDGAKKTLDIDRTLGHDFTAVSGIGDEAYQERNAIFFRKSTVWFSIAVLNHLTPEQNAVALVSQAMTVISRL